MKAKILALFFTCKNGLETWNKVGSLKREIKPYEELSNYFKEIYFFTYGNEKDLTFPLPENIKVFPKKGNMPSILYSFFLPFLYRKELKKVDIIKTNQMSGSWTALLVKLFFKTRVVLRCGYEWLNVIEKEKKPFWKKVFVYCVSKVAYHCSDKIIFTSKKDKEYAKKVFNIEEKKVTIIPNYIDTDVFKNLALQKQDRVIFVGRLAREKNLLNLAKACSDLKIQLCLIGQGDQKEQLKQVNQAIDFKGSIPNDKLPLEINKSLIFCLPSFYEGCPKALLEAMACGLACVASNVEGIKEIINEDNGVLTDTDELSIKEGIQRLLNNETLRKKIGEKARETIEDRFSLNKIIEKELKLYIEFYEKKSNYLLS